MTESKPSPAGTHSKRCRKDTNPARKQSSSNVGSGTTSRTTKRYPRVTAGPLRHKYVHRVVAAAMVGRDLERDEEVHHKDGDRRNFWFANLMILGSKDHGWVSAKQSWYWKQRDHRLKQE